MEEGVSASANNSLSKSADSECPEATRVETQALALSMCAAEEEKEKKQSSSHPLVEIEATTTSTINNNQPSASSSILSSDLAAASMILGTFVHLLPPAFSHVWVSHFSSFLYMYI